MTTFMRLVTQARLRDLDTLGSTRIDRTITRLETFATRARTRGWIRFAVRDSGAAMWSATLADLERAERLLAGGSARRGNAVATYLDACEQFIDPTCGS